MALEKTPQEIQFMREGGALLSKALQAAVDAVRPGVVISHLDKKAEKVIRDGGGEPSFLGYKVSPDDTPFPSTVCISVNHEIVHGSGARSKQLKKGDVVGLDIGCWYKGLATDMAVTVPVGGVEAVSKEVMDLLNVTKQSMMKGVEAAVVGNSVKDISRAVESYVLPYGFGIIRALVGHGVGHAVHEQPHVPNFLQEDQPDIELVDGMCLAIEPMLSLGDYNVETADDGWSVLTRDGSLSSHFELTVAITNKGTEILTPTPNVGF